jgi:HlyD family secretion protein
MADNDALSLDAPSSPEQLDRVIRITSPHSWLGLLMLAVIVAAVAMWSVLGQLPSRAQGLGFVRQSGQESILLTATSGGTVQAVHVEIGQAVLKGDLLFTVGRGDLDLQLAQAQQKAGRLQQQLTHLTANVQTEIEQRRALNAKKIESLRRNIAAQSEHRDFLRVLLDDQLADLERGFVKRTDVEDTRTSLNNAEIEIAKVNAEILSDTTDLREFENQQHGTIGSSQEELAVALAEVQTLQAQVTSAEDIRSPSDGQVLELSIIVNDQINVGDELALIDLVAGATIVRGYILIADAQLVQADMPVQVALASAPPEIYGTMLGTVERVNPVPSSRAALMDIYENSDVVDLITESGPPYAIEVSLTEDPSTPTGFKWSTSQGPPVPLAVGSLASVAITYESRRPIEFVLPFINQLLN